MGHFRAGAPRPVSAIQSMAKMPARPRMLEDGAFHGRFLTSVQLRSSASTFVLLQVAPTVIVTLAWCRSDAFSMSRMAGPFAKFLHSLP
jgi:hypothetical protein